MPKIKATRPKPRPAVSPEQVVIDKLSRLISNQQEHVDALRDEVDTLRQTNRGLVALLVTANCEFCDGGFYDHVDMVTGEVEKRPCLHCSGE